MNYFQVTSKISHFVSFITVVASILLPLKIEHLREGKMVMIIEGEQSKTNVTEDSIIEYIISYTSYHILDKNSDINMILFNI